LVLFLGSWFEFLLGKNISVPSGAPRRLSHSLYSFVCHVSLKWGPSPKSPLNKTKKKPILAFGEKVSTSCKCFKLGRVVEMSWPTYLLFWQRMMELSMGMWQDLIEY
jgi:hypothetical protein